MPHAAHAVRRSEEEMDVEVASASALNCDIKCAATGGAAVVSACEADHKCCNSAEMAALVAMVGSWKSPAAQKSNFF